MRAEPPSVSVPIPKLLVMGDFDNLFASLSEDPRVRGTQFEHVCKWFLENDPVYAHELKSVWLWNDWPGRWGGDAGIDLVAEDRNGDLWAVQAKAYDAKYRVSKKDVDKFLSESGRKVFAYRMLIATTDLIDRTGERTIQQQEKRSSFFRLNDLRAAAVDWPTSPAQLRPAKRRRPAKPWQHQAAAIRDVLKGFKTSERGQLIMACGTGKTLTAWFIREKLAAERTLVLVPSLSLLKQTMREWQTANPKKPFDTLPVCSDETVGGLGEDASVSHTSDLGVPVTTDPEVIAEFLRKRSGPRVVFSTYQSSPQIAAAFALGRVPAFDLVIADEAHRVAGPVSSDFGTVLDPTAIKAKRRLFMTATPRYFTGRVLKEAKEADYEVASMDDYTRFGTVFHRLTFSEAIDRELLTDYQVAIIGVDDATYLDWAENGALVTLDGKKVTDARSLAGQIGLAKAMKKFDLRRVISFHSRVKASKDFAASMPALLDWMPKRQRPKGSLWSRYASGEMSAGERSVLIRHLKKLDDGERGLLANARCLAEGVDVPALDGVAFIDPRRSEVDIVQAVGRAIRKSDNKTVGTIVIPVFIDTDEDAETALDSSVFKPVWDVIKALRAHDTELGEQLDELRRQMGRKGGKPRLPGKIHVDVPASVSRDFVDAFKVHLVDSTTAPWEFWYGLLEKYVAEHGHARVPRSVPRLGSWINTQRRKYVLEKLQPERQVLLENVHPTWSWDAREDAWDEGFNYLRAYLEQHGNARPLRSYQATDGFPLGRWINIQRVAYHRGKLDKDRQARLESLHPTWTWDAQDGLWEDGFGHLRNYIEQNGHARVPAPYVMDDGFRLGGWANVQRTAYVRGKLSPERRARLEGIDPTWSWSYYASQWEEGFERLRTYVKAKGDALVPFEYVTSDGYRLGGWVVKQRSAYAEGKISTDRQTRLEDLHPTWAWTRRQRRPRKALLDRAAEPDLRHRP